MISFVQAELEVTLEMDHVVYSDDNVFLYTGNMIFLHALCHLLMLDTFKVAANAFCISREMHISDLIII